MCKRQPVIPKRVQLKVGETPQPWRKKKECQAARRGWLIHALPEDQSTASTLADTVVPS
jgi:hypothetical protein